jgi:hypothetical protein
MQAVYGLDGVLGPWSGAATNGLPNNGGMLRLRHRTGAVLLSAPYSNLSPWPVAADGAGHSLILANPSYGEGDPRAWAASDTRLGSPGRLDPITADPLAGVMINEVLAHTDPPLEDYLELYNHSNEPKDLSGAWLSDSPTTNKFQIPTGVVLPARGFVHFTERTLGFGLSSGGESLSLINSNRTRVIDAIVFGPQESGVAYGRAPDGAALFYLLAARTPGTNNASVLLSPVVINEIMYHPISGDDDDQYVELYNRTASEVTLTGWQLEGGISFIFPSNTVLPAHSFLVIARNAARLRANYPNLSPNNCLGNCSGRLARRGERLALSMPDLVVSTNATGALETNTIHIVLNEVTYGTGGRWGKWSNGGGSSLELISPESDNRLAPNWADSDETAKAPWTLIERRGVVDNGNVAADQLQVLLQGAGECLIDNVEVLNASGVNLIANSTFESNASGWTAQGTESPSSWETSEGFNSARSFHVRAVDRGDNQINRIRTPLTATLPSGTTATLRARVRWLRGHPEILLRLRGNWLEVAGRMALPGNLGTPGAPNSRAVNNAPPAIYDVAHRPILPAAGQGIVVTANISDPNGLASATLLYRLDPATSYTAIPLRDNGTGGDTVAGDGLFSAAIPGQTTGALIAFYVQAIDNSVPAATSRFPDNAPARECLVRFGESVPTGDFPVYRFWLTQTTFNTWTSRHKLDNTPNDVTFVLGDQRVIYNTLALFAGSPYIAPGFNTPAGNRCGYSVIFSADDPFLGDEDLVLDWPGGHGGETTGIQEQMAYWIADRMNLPFSYRYFIRLHVNGVTDMQRGGVFEAVMQPAGDYLDQWSFGDTSGDFYKIDRAFEFNDSSSRVADPMPRLQLFTTTDPADGSKIKKTERYRWTWLPRSYKTANNYTNLFALVDALNAAGPEPYTSQTEALVDTEQWMGMFAFEHIVNNFDSWGHVIGKNMYCYKPTQGRWQLYPFDLDWLMLVSPRYSSEYTASNGPLFNADDPTVVRMYNHPPFRRAYFRAVQDAVNGPLSSALCNPVMDAKYASLVANGVTMCDGSALSNPDPVKTWFKQRHDALLAQLATVAASFAVAGPATLTVQSNLVKLTGTAPITLCQLTINGVAWPLTWTTVTNWTVQLPMTTGTNRLVIAGADKNGNPIPGANKSVTVVRTGVTPSPQGAIVINELMPNPKVPDAEYVELFNTSSNAAFDLSGWIFRGLDYTFPPGSYLSPRSFLVLVKDLAAFNAAYGAAIAPFGQFNGNLQSGGETLTLIKPGADGASDLVVAKVRYDDELPWPTNANATGSSLQLIDPLQDNWRVGNWSVVASNAPPAMQWIYVTATGTASSSTLYVYLQSAGDLYLDDLMLVAGSAPEAGANTIRNGDFESTFPGSAWTVSANHSASAVSTSIKHSGNASLHLVAVSGGSTQGSSIWQSISPALTSGATYTLSFWYRQSTNGGPLTIRLSGSGVLATVDPAPPARAAGATPGASNTANASLPVFPPLWINELQADNITGITNKAGQRSPWIELYNPSSNTVSLNGLYLANNYTNLTAWAFPAGASINPSQFVLVFADGQTNRSTLAELHTSFALTSRSGSVALSRLHQGQPQVLDYVNYLDLTSDRSFGSFPDGQSFDRREFCYVTPSTTNNAASASLTVFLNEWMADNTITLADPADNQYEDWFELYNPGPDMADLRGYFLADNLTNRFQFPIPNHGRYQIPPRGFLLVWADGEPDQNHTNSADLHVNFKLDKTGEAIGLFAADGMVIDAVTFGAQAADVSQGRSPDGHTYISSLSAATPGTNNPALNSAPTITAPGDKWIYLGQTLRFEVQASDADRPSQTLAYTLATGAPFNATIDPATGLFTWTPTAAQAPGANIITVRVSDNGVPPLSASQTFTATVLLPPSLVISQVNASTLNLSWLGMAGKIYRIQSTESLATSQWITLDQDHVGAGGLLSFKIDLASGQQRFYRIVIVQ